MHSLPFRHRFFFSGEETGNSKSVFGKIRRGQTKDLRRIKMALSFNFASQRDGKFGKLSRCDRVGRVGKLMIFPRGTGPQWSLNIFTIKSSNA